MLCLNFGEQESRTALKLVMQLRDSGIRADLYPDSSKVAKQFKYADRRQVPYVILIGDEELRQGRFTAKDMQTGEQQTYSLEAWEEFRTRLRP